MRNDNSFNQLAKLYSNINNKQKTSYTKTDPTSPYRFGGINQDTLANMCAGDESIAEEIQRAIEDIVDAKGRFDEKDYAKLAKLARQTAHSVISDALHYVDFDKIARVSAAPTLERVLGR